MFSYGMTTQYTTGLNVRPAEPFGRVRSDSFPSQVVGSALRSLF